MYCDKCGNKISDSASFCKNCGNSVKVQAAEKPTIEPISIDDNYILKPNEKYGGFWIRAGAYSIDTALSLLAGALIVRNFEINAENLILVSYIIFFVYMIIATTLYSTTLGKKVFGLRVVNKKGGNTISFWKSLGRCLSYFLSSVLFYAGFWTAGLDEKKQSWHDKIASTLVIRDKRVGFSMGIFLTAASIGAMVLVFMYIDTSSPSDKNVQSQENTKNVSTNNTTAETQEISPVEKADYQEGYKAGYADGRSSYGQLGDNYAEPATEERRSAYFVGYLFGFSKGCKESNFDCSAIESAINSIGGEQKEDVNLIPSDIN